MVCEWAKVEYDAARERGRREAREAREEIVRAYNRNAQQWRYAKGLDRI